MKVKKMKKGKYFLVFFIILIIILGVFFVTYFTNKKSKKNSPNIVDIECNGKECEENKVDNSNIDEKKNTKEEVKNNDSKQTNINNDSKKDNLNNNSLSNDNSAKNDNSNTSGNTFYRNVSNSQTNNSVNSNTSNSEEVVSNIDDNTPAVLFSNDDSVFSQNFDFKIFNVERIGSNDSGTYNFKIKNNVNGLVKYIISFDEQNDYNVNMMYKIKRNNEYVLGDENNYVKIDSLNLGDRLLEVGKIDEYTIDWKWINVDSYTDKAIVEGSKYVLNAKVESFVSKIDAPEISHGPKTGDNIINYLIIFMTSLIMLFVLKRRKKYESN